ncbi:MAG: acyl-CoA thioesterase [Myxococcales bacterium]|nr:acyl-CoA thioesterase [Myxococcales bacterium]
MSFIVFPEPPEVSGLQLGRGQSRLRFEDVAQDGRLRLEGIWPAIGPILWGKMEVAGALQRLGISGVRAVLTYVQLEGGKDPVSVRALAEQEVRWRLGRTIDADGATTRILFDTWLVSKAPRGVPGNPAVDPASGELVLLARAYGQHVFTKPAAPAGQHRVTQIDDPLLDAVSQEETSFRDPRALAVLPAGAEPLEPAPRLDVAPIVFGLCHTDGNQHVNFLSYPRLAEEAGLRRLAELGQDPRRLARRAEVAYRKPCFAGDVVRLVMQAFRLGDELGVVAAFVPDAGAAAGAPEQLSDIERPLCVVRVGFSS